MTTTVLLARHPWPTLMVIRPSVALGLVIGLLTVALGWTTDGLLLKLLLEQAAVRAADEVQLGLLDRVTPADFAYPADDQLDALAARLDPVVARLRGDGSGILRINLISDDGRIVYSDRPSLRGRLIPLTDRPELGTALSGGIGADETSLGGEENADLAREYSRALEVYVPVVLDGQIAGAYEIYEEIGQLRTARLFVWGGLLACWVASGAAWATVSVRRRRAAPSEIMPDVLAESHVAAVQPPSRVNAERDWRVRLTPREIEVLRLMATSHGNRDIAEQLGISQETVRTHVKRILHKLEQPDRTQAVLAALRQGLLDLP